MESILLDTDVFSLFFKRDSRSELYGPDIQGRRLCVCFMTVAELKQWAILRDWGDQRRASLDRALARCVVLPSDPAMTDAWASISAYRRRQGRPINCGDCWIAAAAVRHRLTLVTHNASHYAGLPGLAVVSRSGPGQA